MVTNKRSPVTTMLMVTPEMASRWLAQQHPNRRVNVGYVRYLVAEMKAGNWQTTHQGIALDWNDRLVDGQHRLHAIVASGQTVMVQVTRGVDYETSMAAVDQGRVRSAGDMLRMTGEANYTQKATVTRTLHVLVTPTQPFTARVSQANVVEALGRFRGEMELVLGLVNRTGHRSGLRLLGGNIAPVVLNHLVRPELTEPIIDGMHKGESLSAGAPVLAMRNWQIAATKTGEGSRGALILLTKMIACLDALNKGEQIGTLKASRSRFVSWCRTVGVEPNVSLLSYLEN